MLFVVLRTGLFFLYIESNTKSQDVVANDAPSRSQSSSSLRVMWWISCRCYYDRRVSPLV